jgi:sugar fermentation stimulation protein A
MKFPVKLQKMKLLKRYKRFLADVQQFPDRLTFTAHCPNPGSMKTLLDDPNTKVWVRPHEDARTRLPYTIEIIERYETLIGVNTMHPNKIAKEAIEEDKIQELSRYTTLKTEVKYGKNSRVDIVLQADDKPDAYVEVKNVTMKRGEQAQFPDSVTKRGKKHLEELMDVVKKGYRGVMLFIIQREDCKEFGIAEDIDPDYAATLKEAMKQGVEVLAYACKVTPEEIYVNKRVKVNIIV